MGGKLRLRLCKRIAHVRGGCTPGNSRLGAVSCAHACTNRWRTCAAGVISQANMPHGSAGQFAPLGPGPQWGPSRTDRAGRRDWRLNAASVRTINSRARRGWVKVFRQVFSKICGGGRALPTGMLAQYFTLKTRRRTPGRWPRRTRTKWPPAAGSPSSGGCT